MQYVWLDRTKLENLLISFIRLPDPPSTKTFLLWFPWYNPNWSVSVSIPIFTEPLRIFDLNLLYFPCSTKCESMKNTAITKLRKKPKRRRGKSFSIRKMLSLFQCGAECIGKKIPTNRRYQLYGRDLQAIFYSPWSSFRPAAEKYSRWSFSYFQNFYLKMSSFLYQMAWMEFDPQSMSRCPKKDQINFSGKY